MNVSRSHLLAFPYTADVMIEGDAVRRTIIAIIPLVTRFRCINEITPTAGTGPSGPRDRDKKRSFRSRHPAEKKPLPRAAALFTVHKVAERDLLAGA